MLRCREVVEMASDYLNGDLSGRSRFAVRLHLTLCRACRRYLRQIRATMALLRSLPEARERDDRPARDLFRAVRRR